MLAMTRIIQPCFPNAPVVCNHGLGAGQGLTGGGGGGKCAVFLLFYVCIVPTVNVGDFLGKNGIALGKKKKQTAR